MSRLPFYRSTCGLGRGMVLGLCALAQLALTACDASPGSTAGATFPAPELDATPPRAAVVVNSAPPAPTSGPTRGEAAAATTFYQLENAGPPQFPPPSCPITPLPETPFVPPAPYREQPAPGYFWYGSPVLWTELPEDGRWFNLPYRKGRGYTQKMVFWNEEYDWRAEPEPALTLEGRRLDASAPSLEVAAATNAFREDYGSFIITGGSIPTEGCWEFTARYRDGELTFVVWVAP